MTSETYDEIKLELSSEVTELMESRGILEKEIKMVIHEAEANGVKLYDPDGDHSLAKKCIGDVTYFVEYRPASDAAFEVVTTYCFKSTIVED